MFFDQELCLFHIKPKDQTQLFEKMYKKLYLAGCVKTSFLDGIMTRESEYPTGLEFNSVGFAIPHTDSIHVNKSQICFASLDKPVVFQDMTDKNNNIEVNLVFMLAMAAPHEQVETLQNLMTLFTDDQKVKQLRELSSQEEFIKLLNNSGIY
ncbi:MULTISPECIES: PTS sugar transporter subunit IIA [Lactobacillales]|jgi:PTS family fructose/mannitol porter component IIA|uniref:Phosphoenolpyruvate-dependent sugar phosphotransferase system, EIIA 2 n=2 Tax=Lactobacillales TaxID=186826 RepID=A0A133Y4K4_9LACT|nr:MULTISPECIES: PTS sugar transporter subunit IIA [Lactobacillales]KXB38128.1 phosphoenolpyruvate-dependent sugar phosphotransferase system, EIIA 2 [Aerococcus christensenii]MDK8233721.1 PTS sugar transporter subunit IIA [Aerococcus christensenii]RSJ06086.1 PTS system galactitol-specific transporter subunit IIA [Streptococcus mitis]